MDKFYTLPSQHKTPKPSKKSVGDAFEVVPVKQGSVFCQGIITNRTY